MVLDNRGVVSTWTTTAPVTSHGPRGILDVQAPIVTIGKGARGFNLYDGSLEEVRFESIATIGDGAMGIQVSKPLRRLVIAGDTTTSGREGLSLVKGVRITLQAVALSIKPAGNIESLEVGGQLVTHGRNVTTSVIKGTVGPCGIDGGIHAKGEGSDAVHAAEGRRVDLDKVGLSAAHGETAHLDAS